MSWAVTDNTSTNKLAWKLLKDKNPGKFFAGCVSHGLHLMVKDVFNAAKTKRGGSDETKFPNGYPFAYLLDFANDCKDVVKFFQNHHVPNSELKKALSEKKLRALVLPAATRWGSLLSCFQSLKDADECLHQIVSQRQFDTKSGSGRQNLQRSRIKGIILDGSSMTKLTKSIAILEPINMFITKFQSDSVPASDVVKAFQQLPALFCDIEAISQNEKNYLMKLTKDRYEFMYGDVHGIAYILDPRYLGEGMDIVLQRKSEDKMLGFVASTTDLSTCEQERSRQQTQVLKEYTAFRLIHLQEKNNSTMRYQMFLQGTPTCLDYWFSDGHHWPNLKDVAIKVFSMTALLPHVNGIFPLLGSSIPNLGTVCQKIVCENLCMSKRMLNRCQVKQLQMMLMQNFTLSSSTFESVVLVN
jgi:hypothetical protein